MKNQKDIRFTRNNTLLMQGEAMPTKRPMSERLGMKLWGQELNITTRDVLPILLFLLLVAVLGFVAKEIMLEARIMHKQMSHDTAQIRDDTHRLYTLLREQNQLMLFLLMDSEGRQKLQTTELWQYKLREFFGGAPTKDPVPTPSERWWQDVLPP